MASSFNNLFVYPIDRYIPPVAKVGNIEETTIAMELHEYVVTAPIEQALVDFLKVYSDSRTGTTDQIGVWISGFFGSGKSHFAKVLSYLLTNPTVEGRPAREIFIERLAGSPRGHEIEGLLHRTGLIDSHVIMFNIKTKQDQRNQDDSISEIMYRQYLAERGLSTDPVVATLELSLIERGLYDAFQSEVMRRRGNPWNEEREDYLFIYPTVAEALQAVAPESYHSREEALQTLKLVENSQRLTVSDLAQRLVNYVDKLAESGDPERPPHLVFILDEIGQFIGTDDQKLLELQSIAHEFDIQGKGKLWIMVTAQAKLHEIVGGVKAMDADFGKIGDRFDTRLALSAEDVEKVLEGRILKKKVECIANIKTFYHDHEGSLSMLSALPGASRDLPAMTVDEFTADTPFLPYHPTLIQDIFGSVRSTSATGFSINPEARSMIGMAQGVLRAPDNGFVDGELGKIVTMDMVYDQIAVDLQSQDKREIKGVPDHLPDYCELDQRVLKALYLLQSVPWITVTAETLAHSLLRDVRTENVSTLQGEIEESLQRLQKARYVVAKEGDAWEFLTGAKKSFEEDVSSVIVRQIDLRRETRSMLGQVLRPIGKLNYKRGLRSFDVTVRGDGEEFKSGEGIILDVFSPIHRQLEDGFSIEDTEQIESFNHPETVYWVADENLDLRKYLVRAIRLEDVLKPWRSRSANTQEEREIIREKETELNSLQGKIKTSLRVALTNGTIIWNGRAEALDGSATTLNPIFNRHVSLLVSYVYPKFDLAAVKPNEQAIKDVLAMAHAVLSTVGTGLDLFGQDGHLNQHSAAVGELRDELKRRSNRGYDLSGKALEEHFTRGDYGWDVTNLRLILAAMFRSGLITVKADNVHYTDHTVPTAQKLFTQVRPFRRAVFYYEETVAVKPAELRQAQDELKVIFDATRREETANVLAEQILEEMKRWDGHSERLALQLRPASYPIPEVLQQSQDLRNRVTRFANPGKVVKAFLEHLDEVRSWHKEAQALYNFVVHDKRLPDFRRAQRLLEEIAGIANMPGAEKLIEDDARQWRERLEKLVNSGQVAHNWASFDAALHPLLGRFREVYTALHEQRHNIYVQAKEELTEKEIAVDDIMRYTCAKLAWDPNHLRCQNCGVALETLDLHIRLLPAETAERIRKVLKDQQDNTYDTEENIERIRLIDILPSQRIETQQELDEILDIIRKAVIKALQEADLVELQ